MRDSNPDTAALLRAGREAFRPQASDRERVLRSLAGALGEGALLDEAKHVGPPKGTAGVDRVLAKGWALAGAGALAVGAVVAVVAHSWTTTPSRTMSPATLSVPAASPAPSAAVPVPPNAEEPPALPREEKVESLPGTARARSSPAPASPDSLPEEVRLLSRAAQQLSAGHADQALRTLEEHERRFPGGALAEERLAARVQSLCALERTAEARAALAKLAGAYPQSPHLDRARRSCGMDAP
jgi:hypothetical protein